VCEGKKNSSFFHKISGNLFWFEFGPSVWRVCVRQKAAKFVTQSGVARQNRRYLSYRLTVGATVTTLMIRQGKGWTLEKLLKCKTPYNSIANPTWGDIFESSFKAQSSKLQRLFSLKHDKRDFQALSFELWNSLRRCHHKWDRLYKLIMLPPQPNVIYPDSDMLFPCWNSRSFHRHTGLTFYYTSRFILHVMVHHARPLNDFENGTWLIIE